jgi:hypothetical protein
MLRPPDIPPYTLGDGSGPIAEESTPRRITHLPPTPTTGCPKETAQMPITLAPFTIDDDTKVLIQTSEVNSPGLVPEGGDELVGIGDQLDRRLRDAVDRVRPAAAAVLDSLKELNSPRQVELEFGIGVTGSMDAFIASSEANVSFKVTLTWENPAKG